MRYLLRLDRPAFIGGEDLQPGIVAAIDSDHPLHVVEHALRNPHLVHRDQIAPDPAPVADADPDPAP